MSESPPRSRIFGAAADAAWGAVVFRVMLGLVFALAFGSLLPQICGLLGEDGISPAAELLRQVRESLGISAIWRVPTIFHVLGASDAALTSVCVAGIALGLLLAAGIAPKPVVAALWLLYLSIVSVGDVFLGYQWDALLLETAFFAFFLFPSRLRVRVMDAAPPPRAGVFLLRVLLFKLMFLSGAVKIASGDTEWRGLTALRFHWWTQPLPAWTAWYLHLLPMPLQRLAVAVVLGIELWTPLMIFGPRVWRRVGFVALVFVQLAILATGSYGFFNLLAIALCFLALDDAAFERVAKIARRPLAATERLPLARIDERIAFAGLVVFLPISMGVAFVPPGSLPSPVRAVVRAARPFSTFNTYGLFAVMTTHRREIFVEGSDDGTHWRAYEFRWKPGALDRRPRYPAPHQPRLDWQMWFAGLSHCRDEPWLVRFQQRLLEGSPVVRGLLANDPFPDHPPQYVRTPTFEYRFSDRGSTDWWTRAPDDEFCPPLALEDGRLRRAVLPGE